MATPNPVTNNNIVRGGQAVVSSWTLNGGDTGLALCLADYGDKTVQTSGTFTSGNCAIEGSNDGTNWSPVVDRQGVVITFASAGMKTLQDRPAYIRANFSGGVGAIVATVCCHRTDLAVIGN